LASNSTFLAEAARNALFGTRSGLGLIACQGTGRAAFKELFTLWTHVKSRNKVEEVTTHSLAFRSSGGRNSNGASNEKGDEGDRVLHCECMIYCWE